MLAVRRWWNRYGLRIGLVALAIASAWALRQTQGAAVYELYRLITLPFQTQEAQRTAALETAQSLELQERLIELENQNQRLKQLLDYNAAQAKPGVVAPVVGRSADHWWQQVTLGRGSNHGITEGYVVSGTGGIVGRVVRVTPNTSRVLLVSDPTSQIGVTVSRSRVMGFMRGRSGTRAVMQFFEKIPRASGHNYFIYELIIIGSLKKGIFDTVQKVSKERVI